MESVEKSKKIASAVKMSIERFAVIKAGANCLGLMYEPKRPEKLK